MRVIVAGTRTVTSLPLVAKAIRESGFHVTEVVSGGARGVDRLGELWADATDTAVRMFEPDWSKGKKAGPLRNEQMAAYAEALIAVWDGESRGTADMIARAKAHGLKVYVHRIEAPGARALSRAERGR